MDMCSFFDASTSMHSTLFTFVPTISLVTMSASKLMNQINLWRLESIEGGDSKGCSKEAAAFSNTYSISMDPLAEIAVVFASLTHDAGHKGVPNNILMKEYPDLAKKYEGKSVAEKQINSFGIEHS